MPTVRTRLGLLAVLSLFAGAAIIGLRLAAEHRLGQPPASIDQNIINWLGSSFTFGVILLIAHLGIVRLSSGSTWPYALAGLVAYPAVLVLLARSSVFEIAIRNEAITLPIILPMASGAILGAMYQIWAGFRSADDQSEDLADWLGLTPPDFAAFDPAMNQIVETPRDVYYSGPVQVRTSFGIMILSCMVPFAVLMLLSALLVMSGHALESSLVNSFESEGLLRIVYSPEVQFSFVITVIISVVVLSVVLALPGLAVHKFAQYMRWTNAGAYALSGFGFCFLMGMLVLPLMPMAPFAAVSLAIYRKWAGLEPYGLPDDVVVRNSRALVAADHPRRHYHRVVDLSGGASAGPQHDTATAPSVPGT